MSYLHPDYWMNKIPNLAEALQEPVMPPKQYCVTTWGAVLKVERIHGNQITVSDPDAVDAGMIIWLSEIQSFHDERPEQQ